MTTTTTVTKTSVSHDDDGANLLFYKVKVPVALPLCRRNRMLALTTMTAWSFQRIRKSAWVVYCRPRIGDVSHASEDIALSLWAAQRHPWQLMEFSVFYTFFGDALFVLSFVHTGNMNMA